ncbi:hypothetical protein HDU92_004115 [Lobulomyces angularis]|nr:hypothetical protein HDU92_004115 [Lobulomyces angularis]
MHFCLSIPYFNHLTRLAKIVAGVDLNYDEPDRNQSKRIADFKHSKQSLKKLNISSDFTTILDTSKPESTSRYRLDCLSLNYDVDIENHEEITSR